MHCLFPLFICKFVTCDIKYHSIKHVYVRSQSGAGVDLGRVNSRVEQDLDTIQLALGDSLQKSLITPTPVIQL